MRGIFKKPPSFPKYVFNEIWNAQPGLNMLEEMYPLDNLNLKQLSIKTTLLLALCTAQRVQTLVKIKLNNIRNTTGGMQVTITDMIKTSWPKKQQPILHFPRFQDKPGLWGVTTVLHYIERTRNLRGEKEYTHLKNHTTKPLVKQSAAGLKWACTKWNQHKALQHIALDTLHHKQLHEQEI